MRQVWFVGVHGDVGGKCKPRNGQLLSDIPLAWMATEAATSGLAFERHLHGNTDELYAAEANRSYKKFWKVLGRERRTIPVDGVVHRSVRSRYECIGYEPPALREWLEVNEGWGAIDG